MKCHSCYKDRFSPSSPLPKLRLEFDYSVTGRETEQKYSDSLILKAAISFQVAQLNNILAREL